MADMNELRRLLQMGAITEEDIADAMQEQEQPQNALAQMFTHGPDMPQPRFDIAPMQTNSMRSENGPNAGQVTNMDFRSQTPQQPAQKLGEAVEVAGKGMGRYAADGRSVVFADGSKHDLFPKASAEAAKAAFMRAKEEAALASTQATTAQSLESVTASRGTRAEKERERQMMVGSQASLEKFYGKSPEGKRWTTRGELEDIPGGGGGKLTEFQGKSSAFGQRAAESHEILNAVGQDGKVQPGMIKRMAEGMPGLGFGFDQALGTATNWTQSAPQQQIDQAQRNFINATLRQESGAVISDAEFDNARKQYFPQPGDEPEVIAQKKQNRETVINSFGDSAGPAKEKVAGAGAKARERFEDIKRAQAAIKGGAPADAVRKRLEAAGITGHGL